MVHGLWFMVCKSSGNKPSPVILAGVVGTQSCDSFDARFNIVVKVITDWDAKIC